MEDAINEAFNMIQMAQQMSLVVQEERDRLKDPSLKNLDLKIGINSGKIVGYIIGSKVVRYDIFGEDVLTASQIMEKSSPGTLLVSDATRRLLLRKSQIYETFDWEESISFNKHGDVTHPVHTYTCEPIFGGLDELSIEEESQSNNNETKKDK